MISPSEQVATCLSQSRSFTTALGDGESLVWQRWGEGSSEFRPLVLLHGGFGSWNHWLANLPALMAQRQVWTLDLPGLGASGDMPEPHTTQHFAEVIWHGLGELLGPEAHFDLAGFSFGAVIGGDVAALAGQRCERFTMIGAAGFGELHVQVSLLPIPSSDTPTAEANEIHRENLCRLMLAKSESVDEMAVHLHADNLARFRFRSRRLAGSNDLAEVLPDIKARLVGVWGSDDATAGGLASIEKRAEMLRAVQTDAEFHILPGVGHWAMYEAPDLVNAILLEERSAQ
ncbi:MAG: alpha/beta fold hydrolase [Halioglobus sp.]